MSLLIARLRTIAAGAGPVDTSTGLCHDVETFDDPSYVVGRRRVRLLQESFDALGLDPMFPVGGPGDAGDREYNNVDLWAGRRGEVRRLLAECVADVLEGTLTLEKRLQLYASLRALAVEDGRPDPIIKPLC